MFGLGGSYVIETENAASFWNQFIVNVEAQYTPNRRLTDTGLSHAGDKTDEYIKEIDTLLAHKEKEIMVV